MTTSDAPNDAMIPVFGAKSLAVALIAAFSLSALAWGLGEAFRVKEIVVGKVSATSMPNRRPGSELSVPLATQNSAVSYAVLGGLLAFGAGVAARLIFSGHSLPQSLPFGLVGLALGACGGGASAYWFTPMYLSQMESADVTRSILIHLGIWGTIGGGAGIALGTASKDRSVLGHALIGGILGGAVAAVLFDIVGGFMPLAHTERPLSEETGTRLASHLLIGLAVTLGIALVTSQRPRGTVNQS